MPAKSKAQLRWVNSPAGHKALGAAGVKEWNSATRGRKLPEKVTPMREADFRQRARQGRNQ